MCKMPFVLCLSRAAGGWSPLQCMKDVHIAQLWCILQEAGPLERLLDTAEGDGRPELRRYKRALAADRGARFGSGASAGASSQQGERGGAARAVLDVELDPS